MLDRDIGEEAAHDRAQGAGELLHEAAALGEAHEAEPQRHDADERERDFHHGGVGHLKGAGGDLADAAGGGADDGGEQDEREPEIIQHRGEWRGREVTMRVGRCGASAKVAAR